MNEFVLMPLFAMPLYFSKVDLTKEDITLVKSIKYKRLTSNNGDVSEDMYLLDDVRFKSIRERIEQHVNRHVYGNLKVDNTIKFEITNSWVMRHHKNDWAPKHQHSNSILSGILYIETEEGSGDLIFDKDYSYVNLFPPAVDVPVSERNVFNSKTWTFYPEPGHIYIFPSHLMHYVTESKSENLRYCLPFNLYPVGTLGNEHTEKMGILELKSRNAGV